MKLFHLLAFILSFIVIVVVLSCGSGGSGGDNPIPPEEIPTITNPILENDAPLGISSYAMGVPNKFPLEDSQTPEGVGYKSVAKTVRHIATNELYTFAETPDYEQLYNTIKSFVDNGHLVTHEIHILNGPGIRNKNDPWIESITGQNPGKDTFNSWLKYDPKVRDAILNLFAEAVAHAKRLETLGNVRVIICPELEDNHRGGESGEFGILLGFLQQAGWTNPDGSLRRQDTVRNTMLGDEIQSLIIEKHCNSISCTNSLRPGDIFNNDGVTFVFDSDNCSNSRFISEDNIRQMRDIALAHGVIFYAWHSELQGRKIVNCQDQAAANRKDRTYVLRNPITQASILLGIKPEEVTLKQ